MQGWISFCIGMAIVLITMIFMRASFIKASVKNKKTFSSLSDENVQHVLSYLQKIEEEIHDLNEAYYNIVSDLEGKYSVHEKEIESLYDRLSQVESYFENLLVDKKAFSSTHSSKKTNQTLAMSQKAQNLKKEGLSSRDIARKLNMGIGETELLLKMAPEIEK